MEIKLETNILFRLDDLSPYFSVVLMRNEKPYKSAKKQSAQLREWLEILKLFQSEEVRIFKHENSTKEVMFGSH